MAIADIDNDGKAEIALKREGSPYGILAVAGGFNQPPQLGGNISNRPARGMTSDNREYLMKVYKKRCKGLMSSKEKSQN